MISLRQFAANDADMRALALSSTTSSGRVIMRAAERLAVAAEQHWHREPLVNPPHARDDLRYWMGRAEALRDLLSLEASASSEALKAGIVDADEFSPSRRAESGDERV